MYWQTQYCKSILTQRFNVIPIKILAGFFFFLRAIYQWHMEVLRLEVKLELQLPAYTTATATRNPRHICDLYQSSWQRQILNPLSEDRDQTHIFMDTSWVCNLLNHNRNSQIFKIQIYKGHRITRTKGWKTFSFFCCFFLFQTHPQHMEIPGPGI